MQIVFFLIYFPILWAAKLGLPIWGGGCGGGAYNCIPALNLFGWALLILTYAVVIYVLVFLIRKIVRLFN